MKASYLVLIMALAPVATPAVESTGREAARETSELREFSTRPLVVYTDRGRRDPFLSPLSVASVEPDQSTLRVSELRYVGMVGTDTQKVAMFRPSSGLKATLMLRGGLLYGPGNRPVPNVTGKILGKDKVVLRQGNEILTFTVSH